MALEFTYAIVQPYTDRSDRMDTAIVLSTHRTAAHAFAALDLFMNRLQQFNLPHDTIEMHVVDSLRRPVVRA